jgi:hypothetical protein
MNPTPHISTEAPQWSRATYDADVRRPGETSRAARSGGFVGSIVVNAIVLYIAHHVLEWQIGWITPAWSDVLWAVDLTLWASIVANALYLAFDAVWFRNLAGAVSCGLAVLATWWVYVVFPFDFGVTATNDLVRLALAALLLATAIATVVLFILAVVEVVRAALRA